jgi:hypothetical protein
MMAARNISTKKLIFRVSSEVMVGCFEKYDPAEFYINCPVVEIAGWVVLMVRFRF